MSQSKWPVSTRTLPVQRWITWLKYIPLLDLICARQILIILKLFFFVQATDLSRSEASEEDKIKAMMTQSTQDYDPSK